MQPHVYVPSQWHCSDTPGNGLLLALCRQGDTPVLRLVAGNGTTETGHSVHIPPGQLPELIWAMLERSGADPGALLDAVRDIARAHPQAGQRLMP